MIESQPLPTIAQALKACNLPALETRLLLSHATGLPREKLVTHRERRLSAEQIAVFLHLVHARAHGQPMAYLLRQREFYGRNYKITPHVLIPRPETELLIDVILDTVPTFENMSILDLGTGSGVIAITLALEIFHAQVTATDINRDALNIAAENADIWKTTIRFLQSDWWQYIEQRFDLIVSNPPYIAVHDHHLQQGDLRFEPPSALTDFADGLSAYRTIIDQAPHYLHSQGWLWLEHGYDQATDIQRLLELAGFENIQTHRDLANHTRVSGGQFGKIK